MKLKPICFLLELTKDPDVFIGAMVSLARANLSDVSPPPYIRWFAWTHPTTLERIAQLEEFRSLFRASFRPLLSQG